MRDHLKAFLAYLKLNRHVSPHTVRAYESDVTQYLAWVAGRNRQEDVGAGPGRSRHDLGRVAPRRAEQGRQGAISVARKLSALRTFVKYLRREEIIEHDPTAMAVAPKRDQTIPIHLSEPEIARLIETPEHRRCRSAAAIARSSSCFMRRPALERAGRDRSRGSEPQRAHGARDGQGRQGAARAVQPEHAVGAQGVDARSRRDSRVRRRHSAPTRPTANRRAGAASRRRDAAEGREATTGSAVRQLSRHAADRPQRRSVAAPLRRAVQHAHGHQPARAAPFVCDASAAARRRSARHPGAARPRAAEHDAALHPRQRRAADRRVSQSRIRARPCPPKSRCRRD